MLLISFCHGYLNEDSLSNNEYFLSLAKKEIPSVILFDEKKWKINDIISFKFPRLEQDFFNYEMRKIVKGELPKSDVFNSFVRKPRYGVMGLSFEENSKKFYAATWNGIYECDINNFQNLKFITHCLINDPHGIDVKNGKIYSVITPLDLVVVTNINDGSIIDYFSINVDLSVEKNKKEILDFDWRFITKQSRGALGNWHFNDIRVEGTVLYLSSRLTSCVVTVDLVTKKCNLKTIAWDTPVMIHDGIIDYDGNVVFTSVDGKILICNKPSKINYNKGNLSEKSFHPLMKRNWVSKSIRIENILKRDINWCRGLCDDKNNYYTTIDGRYDQKRPYFSLAEINKENLKIREFKFSYDILPFPSEIRYMTGFSVIKI